MAVTFVGSVIAHGVEAGGGGSYTPDFSGVSWQDDDFAIATYFESGTGSVTAPADWYQLWNVLFTSPTRNTTNFYKFLATGEDETPTFTRSAGLAASISVVISIWRGVDTQNPFDAYSQIGAVTNDATPTPLPVTTLVDGCLILTWMALDIQTSFTSAGAPSGYTLTVDYSGATYDDRQQFIASRTQSTAGTETPGDWTHTATPGNTEDGVQQTFALRPVQSANYPVLAGQAGTITGVGVMTATHSINLPAGITSGDLIYIVAGVGAAPVDVSAGPAGFTRVDPTNTSVANFRAWAGWKVADGTEGSTVTLTTNNPSTLAARAFRITNWFEATFYPMYEETAGSSFDPPLIEPDYPDENMYISSVVRDEAQPPSGYNWMIRTHGGLGTGQPVRTQVATKQSPFDTENPLAWFTIGANAHAAVLAVRGAGSAPPTPPTGGGWGIPIHT